MPRLDGKIVDRIERARAFSQLTDVTSEFDEVAKQAESAAQVRKAAICEALADDEGMTRPTRRGDEDRAA